MKKQIEARQDSKHTVHWEMNEAPQCAVLHMNMVKVLHKSNMFAQITCRFVCRRCVFWLVRAVQRCLTSLLVLFVCLLSVGSVFLSMTDAVGCCAAAQKRPQTRSGCWSGLSVAISLCHAGASAASWMIRDRSS